MNVKTNPVPTAMLPDMITITTTQQDQLPLSDTLLRNEILDLVLQRKINLTDGLWDIALPVQNKYIFLQPSTDQYLLNFNQY